MGNPPQRPDQRLQPTSRAGTGPAPQTDVVRAREVIVSGPSGGVFVYNATRTMLEASIAGSATTDPILGVTVPAGFATYNSAGRVINLLSTTDNAFFQYFDHPPAQGVLILAVSSAGGTDPVTSATYPAGLFGVDPAFGDTLEAVGAAIAFGQAAYTQPGNVIAFQGSGSTSPSINVFAPEQGQSGHLVMTIQGTSPDGTHPGQLLIASEPTGGAIPTPITGATVELQSPTSGITNSLLQLITASGGVAGDNMMGFRVSGDANNRLRMNADGTLRWGPGTAGLDCQLDRASANLMAFVTCDVDVSSAGRGLRVAEGSNAKQGTATLAGGTVVVANTSVTANSRIFLTAQTSGAGPGALRVSARTAGTSFTITSSNAADTSLVAWEIFEPG